MKLVALASLLASAWAFAASSQPTETVVRASTPTALELGYSDSYNLDFGGAHNQFSAWEQAHPADPMGPVSQAASYLFSELDRLGVLETQFYEKDSTFLKREKLEPDPKIKLQFDAALAGAETKANTALAKFSDDRNALFAMALLWGLRADYAALIEKKNLESLKDTRQADEWAHKLLALSPDYYDAYLATGISKYIIGSLAAPVRWLLRVGGYSGDKKTGIHELELAAQHGHYLAPFARILLSIAYLRQNDSARARSLLEQLHDQFPANPLFPREIARIDGKK
jgi:tetratricopeptide (TPR) repeat protein